MLSSAPRNAARGTQEISPRSPPAMGSSQLGKKISPKIPPREAPPETPSICGQASGLRSSAWSTTPQEAMPPPIATPNSTRGRRARKRISALGSEENIFSKARRRSTGTGPTSEQPITERTRSRKRIPLTWIIFLRFRTCTSTPLVALAVRGIHETFGMNEARKLRRSLPESRAGPQNLVGRIGIDTSFPNGWNGFEIAPTLHGLFPLRSHPRFDDDLRRFGDHDLVGQIKPGLSGAPGDVVATGQSDQLVDKILAAHRDQGLKPNYHKHRTARRRSDPSLHGFNLGRDFCN